MPRRIYQDERAQHGLAIDLHVLGHGVDHRLVEGSQVVEAFGVHARNLPPHAIVQSELLRYLVSVLRIIPLVMHSGCGPWSNLLDTIRRVSEKERRETSASPGRAQRVGGGEQVIEGVDTPRLVVLEVIHLHAPAFAAELERVGTDDLDE